MARLSRVFALERRTQCVLVVWIKNKVGRNANDEKRKSILFLEPALGLKASRHEAIEKLRKHLAMQESK